jgi:hypothetical protein
VQAANVLYSVVNTMPTSSIAVTTPYNIYPLKPTFPGSILFQGYAPDDVNYSYAIIDNATNEIIRAEEFGRSAVLENTLNEFFNRSWNTMELKSFDTVPNIPRLYNRRPDEDLHPRGEIPTIHVLAAQADIDNMHTNFEKDITIKADITYIR